MWHDRPASHTLRQPVPPAHPHPHPSMEEYSRESGAAREGYRGPDARQTFELEVQRAAKTARRTQLEICSDTASSERFGCAKSCRFVDASDSSQRSANLRCSFFSLVPCLNRHGQTIEDGRVLGDILSLFFFPFFISRSVPLSLSLSFFLDKTIRPVCRCCVLQTKAFSVFKSHNSCLYLCLRIGPELICLLSNGCMIENLRARVNEK